MKELSQVPEVVHNIPEPGRDASEMGQLDHVTTRMTRSRAQAHGSTPTPTSYPDRGNPPVVVSSAGLGQGIPDQPVHGDSIPREVQALPRPRSHNFNPAHVAGAPLPACVGQLTNPGPEDGQLSAAIPYEGTESGAAPMPGEGQESMMWYDQLFDSSFSAIDNPLLAAAQFDPSIDPTWSYLR